MKGNSIENLISNRFQEEPFSFNEQYVQVHHKTNPSFATNNKHLTEEAALTTRTDNSAITD